MKFGIPLLGAALAFAVATFSQSADANCGTVVAGDVYGGGGYVDVRYDNVVYAPGPPPAPRREIVPRSPGWGFVWTGGYWVFDVDWYWVPGTWRRPPNRATTVWYTPRYRYERGRYIYTDGGWGDRRRVRTVIRRDYDRVSHRRWRTEQRQERVYKQKRRLERQQRQVQRDQRRLEKERRRVERQRREIQRRDNERRVKKNKRNNRRQRDKRRDRRNERVARR